MGRAFARALLLADEHGSTTLAAPALGTGLARVGLEMSANAMASTLRWHTMLGGVRLREISFWLDSAAKRTVFQAIVEEALRASSGSEAAEADLGLPVEDARTSGDAATCLDPLGESQKDV